MFSECKLKAKETYDRKYKVKTPDYCVGQTVLLKDNRIEANLNKLLTRRSYLNDEFLIVEVVQNDKIGPAYKLLNRRTGELIKNLVNFDRIKAFHTPDDALENITPHPRQFALVIGCRHFDRQALLVSYWLVMLLLGHSVQFYS